MLLRASHQGNKTNFQRDEMRKAICTVCFLNICFPVNRLRACSSQEDVEDVEDMQKTQICIQIVFPASASSSIRAESSRVDPPGFCC